MKTIGHIIHQNKFPMIIRDLNGYPVYREYLDGIWAKLQYNSDGVEIYWENSNGWITDHENNC